MKRLRTANDSGGHPFSALARQEGQKQISPGKRRHPRAFSCVSCFWIVLTRNLLSEQFVRNVHDRKRSQQLALDFADVLLLLESSDYFLWQKVCQRRLKIIKAVLKLNGITLILIALSSIRASRVAVNGSVTGGFTKRSGCFGRRLRRGDNRAFHCGQP